MANAKTIAGPKWIINVEKGDHEHKCAFIDLTNDQKIKLDDFRNTLAGLWQEVTDQKRILDVQINPGLEKIYGTHAHPAPGTMEEKEAKFVNSPLFDVTRMLQVALADIEARTLKVASQINDFQQEVLKAGKYEQKGFRKLLNKPADNAFNNLRRKVSLIVSLVEDVYDDDPPCPGCPNG